MPLLAPAASFFPNSGTGLIGILPFVGYVAQLVLFVHLVGRFGKGTGYYSGVVFLPYIFLPILGLGGDSYKPPFERDTVRRGPRVGR